MIASRTLTLALVAGALGASGCLWSAWCQFPLQGWNDVRLAPAFALRLGINPYPPLDGGPLFTWIYGPAPLFLNLPATLASTPLAALQTACLINLLIVFVPIATIFFGSKELRGRGLSMTFFALVMAVLLAPQDLRFHVADHSAIAFGLLSSWCLARSAKPRNGQLALAAMFCALAIWSKQIAVFLLPAQLLFIAIGGNRGVMLRYFAWVSFFGLAALAVFSFQFGLENIWLNLVAVPGRLPWGEFAPNSRMRWGLLGQVLIPAIGLVVLWRKRLWPSREHESGRFLLLSVLTAAAMLPAGLMALAKIGGDMNSLHSWGYLLPAVILAWLTPERRAASWRGLEICVGVALALVIRARDLATLPSEVFTQHLDAAHQLTAALPHELWFPQNPVLGFYASGKIWHSEDGVLTRNLAGYSIREPAFRRHLPPNLTGVVYPMTATKPPTLSLLPEYSHVLRVPYWTVHVRTPPNPASP